MSCDCRCCAESKPCARVLMLSSKDATDAARVLMLVGEQAGTRVTELSVTVESRRRIERPDLLGTVTCRSCRTPHQVLEFLARFIVDRGVTVQCEACR